LTAAPWFGELGADETIHPLLDATMRKINTRFFLSLLAILGVGAVGIFALHRLQAGNISDALLWQVSQSEKAAKLDQAARYLGRYLEFVPDDLEERAHLATLLAEPKIATTGKRIARARFVIEQVLAKDPQRHALRQDLVRLAILTRQLDFAKEHLDLLPKSGPAAFLEGEWFELQNKYDAARQAYQRAVDASPEQADAYLRLAALYRHNDFGKKITERKHTEDIQQLLKQALQKLPNDPGILSLAAQVAQERGDVEAAHAHLETGLKQDPTEPRLYQALARIQTLDGKRPQAIETLRRGLREVGKDSKYELTWALANLLLDDHQAEEAQKVSAEIRDMNPRSAEYLEARVQMLQGRWFEAAKAFEKLRPRLQALKELTLQLDLYLGKCYEQIEEPALQLAAYRRAVKADPTALAARRGMATAQWSLGQTTEALEEYQQIISSNSTHEDATRWRLEYARLLLQGRPKDLQLVEQEIAEAKRDPQLAIDCTLLQAGLLLRQSQRQEAEAALRKAIEQEPERFEPWIFLADLAMTEGKTEEARRLLRQAEEKVKDSVDFRLARVRLWASQQDEEAETMLRQLETGAEAFTALQQGRLLQALTGAHFAAHRLKECGRLLRQLARLPQHTKDLRVRLQLLEVAMLQKDDAAMSAVLEEMKKIEEGSPSFYGSYGQALRLIWHARNGKRDGLEQARGLLTAAAAQRPNWHAITLARAEIDEMQDKTDQAIAHYRLAVEQGSRDPRVLKQLVYLLSQAQRYDEAEAAVREMQEQFHTPEGVRRVTIALAYNRGDYNRAENLLRQVMQSNSQNFRDYLWLGQVLTARAPAAPEAEAAFRRAVALAGDQPEAWLGLIRYLVHAGLLEKARAEVALAERKLTKETRALALAQCHELLGNTDEALKYYQTALQQRPDAVSVVRAAADFYQRSGRLRDAVLHYRRLMDRKLAGTEQDVARARRGLALSLAAGGKAEQIAEALKLVGLNRDASPAESVEEQLAQARVLAALNTHPMRTRAIALLETLQQKRALGVDDQFLLANLCHLQGHDASTWRKTRELLKEIIHNAPRSARYQIFAAHLFILNKEVPIAEKIVDRLAKLEQERRLAAGALGSIELRARCLELRGHGMEALALLKQYAAQQDAPVSRVLLLAAIHGRLGQIREAIDLTEQVAQRGAADEMDEARGSALAILRAGKPAEEAARLHADWQEQEGRVEKWLRAALARNPKHITTRLQLADLMDLQGQVAEVEKLCRAALAQDPYNLVALNNLAWFLAQRGDRAAEGLDLIERALEKYGPRAELLDTRAVVYLQLGKCAQSLADLQKVLGEAPTPARYFHLSRAHYQAKDRPSALAALQRANELGLTAQQLHVSERGAYQQAMAELKK
jgi:cellulose synthase operon protein C